MSIIYLDDNSIIWHPTNTNSEKHPFGKNLLHPKNWTGKESRVDDPILYFHFWLNLLQLKTLGIRATDPIDLSNFSISNIPLFDPEQLIYVGERESFSNLANGVRNYPWLKSEKSNNNILYTHIFFLEREFFGFDATDTELTAFNKKRRNTLEMLVYNSLMKTFYKYKSCLLYNGGMQFDKLLIYNNDIARIKKTASDQIRSLIYKYCDLQVTY